MTLHAIGAGGMFAYPAARPAAFGLDTVHRVEHDGEAEASLLPRAGDPAAVAPYADHGRLRAGTLEQMQEAAVRGHLANTLAGKQALLVVDTNTAAAELGRHIHGELVRLGLVEPESLVRLPDRTEIGIGDVIQARNNDYPLRVDPGPDGSRLPVTNRELYTVLGRDRHGQLLARDPRGAIAHLPDALTGARVEPSLPTTGVEVGGETVAGCSDVGFGVDQRSPLQAWSGRCVEDTLLTVATADRDDIYSDAARAAGVPLPGVRPLLARHHVGFTEAARSFEQWLLPPPTSVTVILNVGEPFGGLPGAFVAGLDDSYSVVALRGAVSCVDVKLTPLGAYQVFGRPLSELSGRTVGLDDLIGDPVAARMLNAVRAAPGWAERFDLLDGFLAERAAIGPTPAPEVTYVWRRLSSAAGSMRISALAAEIGWSHKRLITQFHRQVGLPPRTVARVARFATMLRRLDHPAGPLRWGDLVETCGYYDQAHLDRDFRQFAGTTPSDFLTRRAGGGSLVGDGLAGDGQIGAG